ncbi:MAG: oligoribonuclease [Pseudomonadota bacterium]
MSIASDRLIWLDMEMTGLNPQEDRIIELAIVVTDNQLTTVAEAPIWVVHQPDEILNGMDDWNKGTHQRSGLIERVRASITDEASIQTEALNFLKLHVKAGSSPMCGNSICQDRRFMARWMPELETFFHYRNLDVSTLKELAKRWKPELIKGFNKKGRHEALADVYESIEELAYYRQQWLMPLSTISQENTKQELSV